MLQLAVAPCFERRPPTGFDTSTPCRVFRILLVHAVEIRTAENANVRNSCFRADSSDAQQSIRQRFHATRINSHCGGSCDAPVECVAQVLAEVDIMDGLEVVFQHFL